MKKSLFGTIIFALIFSNCSDTSEQLLNNSDAHIPMAFSVTQEPIGRAVYYLEKAEDLTQFYVVAQVQDEVYTHQFFSRRESQFVAEQEAFWPNNSSEPVSFYAVNFSPDYNYLRDAVERYNSELGDMETFPISDYELEIPVDGFLYQDLVAAYSVTSANQTTNGVAPLEFKHMLAEVEVYAKGVFPNLNTNYTIEDVTFISDDNSRIYHFDNNTWSTGSTDGKIREIPYFSSNGFILNTTDDYQEILDAGSLSGDNFRFMIPGDYTLQIKYKISGIETTKTCSVTLVQNQKNRINLTLTPD